MGKFKWLGAILAAVSLVLIAVTLDGGTAIGRQATPSQPPLIAQAGLALPDGGTDVRNIEFCVDNIFVDGNSKGNTCFTGQVTFVREDPQTILGIEVIDVEITSLSATGTTLGKVGTYVAGSGLGSTVLAASLGTIAETSPGAGCTPTACTVEFNLVWEIQCGTTPGNVSCCDDDFCSALENCGTDTFTGTTSEIPIVSGVFTAPDSSACLNGITERATGENLVATVSEPPVGGIAERLGTSAGPDSSLDSSSGSGFSYAALGGALAAAAVAVAVGGWYARRRWLT